MEINYFILWASFLTSFVLALIFTPAAIWLAPRIGAMDIPKDERRVHSKPIPRFGGMAIFIGIMTAELLFIMPAFIPGKSIGGILTGGALIYLFGVIDDLKDISPKLKLLGQIAAACVVYASGIRLSFVGVVLGGSNTALATGLTFFLTVLWIVAIINAINLVDGLDGLAAGIAAISSLCIAYAGFIHGHYVAATAMLTVAGGALGFLPYNFHPAKIFMGDGGSQFLGFCLATFSLIQPVKSATIVAVAVPALVLGLPIFDTVFAILRRIIRRQSIVVADKEHLHHRIMRAGFGQRRAVMLMYCISGIMGVVAVEYSRSSMVECLGLLAIAVMLLYVLLSDTSNKKIELNAVNIRKEEEKEKKASKEKKHGKEE
ncbi:undecaprenyl/decaprenyl-phosphate alpha-N-acetylglucosaminyl 1-phosphate transferase [bacterium 210820-DFI.6.37]|nr:undecaprenyl/decaprenyl-phosphate alpha-N-acetylglucosaminyl 1-phosphate transferase [bacterium 210820-DFI.6.37]